MFVDTRAIGFPLTDAIRRHVERRVRAAVGPLAWRVTVVTARLEDVNADRGGVDEAARRIRHAALRAVGRSAPGRRPGLRRGRAPASA